MQKKRHKIMYSYWDDGTFFSRVFANKTYSNSEKSVILLIVNSPFCFTFHCNFQENWILFDVNNRCFKETLSFNIKCFFVFVFLLVLNIGSICFGEEVTSWQICSWLNPCQQCTLNEPWSKNNWITTHIMINNSFCMQNYSGLQIKACPGKIN